MLSAGNGPQKVAVAVAVAVALTLVLQGAVGHCEKALVGLGAELFKKETLFCECIRTVSATAAAATICGPWGSHSAWVSDSPDGLDSDGGVEWIEWRGRH